MTAPTTETTLDLEPRTVEALQDLIGVNIDSAQGFDQAASSIDEPAIATLFRDIARERRAFADRLSAYVRRQGELPRAEGSFRAAMHRWWMLFRGVVQGGDPYSILAEAERGEDRIKARYEEVLVSTAGSAVNDVLQGQHAAVKRRHDRVRELRDEHRATS